MNLILKLLFIYFLLPVLVVEGCFPMNGMTIDIKFNPVTTKPELEESSKSSRRKKTTVRRRWTTPIPTEEVDTEAPSTTIDLEASSKSLSEFVDKSVDPCDDFYQFTCGTFIKNNPVKEKESPKGPILGNQTEFYEFTKSIMVKPQYTNSTALIKINRFLKKCLPLQGSEKSTCMVFLYIFGQYFFASAYLNEYANNKKFEMNYENVDKLVSKIIEEFALILLYEKDDFLDTRTKHNYLTKLGNMKFSREALHFVYNLNQTDECYSHFPLEDYHPVRTIYMNVILGNLFMPRKKETKRYSCSDFFLKTNFLSTMTSINALYFHGKNSVILLPKFLDKPFFDINYPDSFKYGSIGFVIGHEIIHGYDGWGIHFNYEGKIERNMTSNETKKKFRKKSKCFGEQYRNSTGKRSSRFVDVNQLISDNGGIKIAHRAFMKLLKKREANEAIIPEFEEYNSEQLFFINFGKTFCISMAESITVNGTKKAVTNPTRYRINNAISNYAPFSEAFKCKKGSKMNPKNKCELWMH
uniref:Phosphate-regulating neutral endopeptidase (inferred by orthology to a human protein) n=1 Tax=Strongyloides venezuelensis TaxID=75913 RepID=A0A0K0EZX9_STRVS